MNRLRHNRLAEVIEVQPRQRGDREPWTPAAIHLLALLAFGYTLYFTRDLLVPITFAVFLNILLSPVVRRMSRLRIPPPVSAALLVAVLVAAVATAFTVLAEPADKWLRDAPTSLRQLQADLLPAKGTLEGIQEFADEVDELAKVDTQRRDPQPVKLEEPSMLENFVGGLPALFASAGIVVFLSYFLLAAGDNILRRLTSFGRNWTERRRIVRIARSIQDDLARYLATVTTINCCLGAATAAAMYLLDVPNPLLWGAMAALFNFAPYLGAVVSTAVLAIVGLTTFPTLAEALLVPGTFFVLTVLEGQLITPLVLGRRMALSPAVVFVSVVVWGWIWGVAGALMAVPIARSVTVVCDNVPRLQWLADCLRARRLRPLARGAGEVSR